MVPFFHLLSCQSSVSVKENPDRKKKPNRIVPRLNYCFWKNALPSTKSTLLTLLYTRIWPTKHPLFYKFWETYSARHGRVGAQKKLSLGLSKKGIWGFATYIQMEKKFVRSKLMNPQKTLWLPWWRPYLNLWVIRKK